MANFKEALQNFGFGAAGQILNTGLGIMFGNKQAERNDARQLAQQQKLQEMQIAGQKQMVDYNYGKQLDMWNETNYGAQKQHLLKAGLNPALFYGMSGGGGTTTGTPTGNVSAGEAPKGGHEQIEMAGMGIQMQQQAMQLQLLKAQKENIQADTANKQATTTKTAGVDTKSGEQSISESKTRQQLLEQGIDNERQKFEIGKLEITLKNIENFEKQATQADRMDYIEYQTKIAMKQLDNITTEAFLNKQTVNDKIKIIRQEAIGAILRNALTQAQTDKTLSDIKVNEQTIKKLYNDIEMTWEHLTRQDREIQIKKLLADYYTDPTTAMTSQLVNTLTNVFNMTK